MGLVPEVLAGAVGKVIGVSDGQDGRRGLPREASAFEGAGGEGEIPSVKHALREGGGCGLDTKVAEHGIRLPAAKQHDGLGADIGTEESSGSAGAEGASGDLGREDASAQFLLAGSVLEGVGDAG